MTHPYQDRVLALAGLLQALAQVRRIADTGQSDQVQVQTALESVFRIDARDTESVFGSARELRIGLRQLRDYLANGSKDEALGKLALAVLQLERRFIRNAALANKVQAGLRRIAPRADDIGSAHPDVIADLARLYADTLSTLRPRVMVQGNPHYLGQAGVVAEIRALLLAALRAAVLWRQLGGSLWDFVFARRQMAAALDALLG
ncbi:high frequency lysogenization protein HflD [Thermomonas haemolytica]|uniref:High frequency lysogenization protein HflD homolog n=1 Tax=Thermomonas haemolytica TaxID=141949 RepID=A0A4R3NF12_9GAMM|nr:high frequency lysogenization protein HflD [Thermomonas haemolytica]TCT25829.1 high frequency lysogenization protein [Thermomonas haemolytica]TNY30118.1 lysogenization regulator HflD [Thermomonas haemolytica]